MKDFAEPPVLYQVMHPWHWLTYGNNAAAVAAVAAGLGLLGLWRYVVYTRKMMQSSDATLRATIQPVLEVYRLPPFRGEFLARISNLGNGPALGILWWTLFAPDDHFTLGIFRDRDEGVAYPLGALGAQSFGENALIESIPWPAQVSRMLLVVQAFDAVGRRHRIQVLCERDTNANESISYWFGTK